MPEAVQRILGDELEGIDEGEDHAAEGADRSPSLAECTPVEHLEAIAVLPRSQSRKRGARIDPDQRVTMGILANRDAAALLNVERLDPALDEIEHHRPALVGLAARRRAGSGPDSWTGRLLRLRLRLHG